MPIFIYGLCDPHTQKLRYVGKAINPKRRLYRHLSDARKPNPKFHSARWIATLLAQGLKPEMFIIEECSDESWEDVEKFFIEYFRFVGCDLTNKAEGGDCGVRNMAKSPEHRRKIGDAHRGMIRSDEARMNMSVGSQGKNKGKANGARQFLIHGPDGQGHHVTNLKAFCSDHGLSRSNLYRVLEGSAQDWQGWTIVRTGPPMSTASKTR